MVLRPCLAGWQGITLAVSTPTFAKPRSTHLFGKRATRHRLPLLRGRWRRSADTRSAGRGARALTHFTLVHDDIQDESPSRRRPTLWKLWGIGQAINAGDALFAAAQLALLRLNLSPELNLRLVESFNRMTIEIVAGQVLDLGFEGRDDVGADDYLRMIAGKTSAIVRYAAWARALVGGAEDETAGNSRSLVWRSVSDSRFATMCSASGERHRQRERRRRTTSGAENRVSRSCCCDHESTKTNGPNSAAL